MMRRGLTLVEVLASTVLLTLLAATSVPVLHRAIGATREPKASFELLDLALLADSFVAAGSLPDAQQEYPFELSWPERPERPAVTVELLSADTDHVWLTFTCDRWTICRCVAVESQVAAGGARPEGGAP